MDDQLKGRRIRQRGPCPTLSDSEVLTIEIVGEFLGLDTDKGIYRYFRRHYSEWFPALSEVHRATFARQAANLWKIKEDLWEDLLLLAPHETPPSPSATLCPCRCASSLGPTAVNAFAGRPLSVRTPSSQADLLRLSGAREGLLAGTHNSFFSVAAANAHELSVVPEIVEFTSGIIVGERNYHSPKTKEELATIGVELLAPYQHKSADPHLQREAPI